MDAQQWPGEWLRGVLSICVLSVVAERETYGYAVAQRLAQAGLGSVKGGTLYPVLGRLEEDGLVVSQWHAGDAGPGRKFFAVTEAGRTILAQRAQAWIQFSERAAQLLADTKAGAR